MTRTGQDYINSLRDGRAIYLNGQPVHGPVDHPAYRNAVRTVARLYDFQSAPENLELMTFRSPTSGGRVNRCWQLPVSYDELEQRQLPKPERRFHMEHIQNTLLPAFAWLVFGVIASTTLMWVWRIVGFMLDKDQAWDAEETLGLPKGAVRTFIVISFTGIMFLIFFGNFPAIPTDDRKWFLTAYASVLAFYFGSKYFPALQTRSQRRGLAISRIIPSIGNRPTTGTGPSPADIVIEGSGFESPIVVSFTNGAGHPLKTSNMLGDSHEKLTVTVELGPTTPLGLYDVAVELANGSRSVYKAGFTVE